MTSFPGLKTLTNRSGVLLTNHLLQADRPHDQVRTLHHQASLLVLAGVQQQAALVEEGQPLGTVVTRHLDAQRAPIVVTRQAALQGKGIATLQTAKALTEKEGRKVCLEVGDSSHSQTTSMVSRPCLWTGSEKQPHLSWKG